MFEKIQLITRYCSQEKPYAYAFFDHYKSNGLELVHVITQNEKDASEAREFCKTVGLDINSIVQPSELTPNGALKRFNKENLKSDIPLTLSLDMDEYIYSKSSESLAYRARRKMSETGKPSINIFWKMKISDSVSGEFSYPQMFRGHAYKQLVDTNTLKQSPREIDMHCLLLHKSPSLKDVDLVHYCSRSLEDSLLKAFMSNLTNFKARDKNNLASKINDGKIPNKLIMLAFFAAQAKQGSYETPIFIKNLNFDHALSRNMLSNFLDQESMPALIEKYELFRNELINYLATNETNFHPYPEKKATNLAAIGEQIQNIFNLS